MFQIREEQMELFQDRGEREFESRMAKHVELQFPEEHQAMVHTAGPESVGKLIQAAIERAADYGITSEQAVAGLINLDVLYGTGFESTPGMEWSKEILEDTELEDITRINMIVELLPDDSGDNDVQDW